MKVKRSSGKTVPPINYEPHPPREDSDGVFRSKPKQFKAEEVDEDEDVKVDLPIDQVSIKNLAGYAIQHLLLVG